MAKTPAKKKTTARKNTIKVTERKKPDVKQKKKPDILHITDTTLRDAHQSLWATRMRTSDILEIIDVIDNVGYYSLEMWGGATFDVCLRFLRENPWERLRQIKARAKKTPLQMLLRGQNILGYKHYPDDLLDRFIALACENGMDIFRIFDALNDNRNLEKAITSVKKYGGHAQGTISYTVSPVHTIEKYVEIAKEQVQIGIDSLCIKDMAGILSPIDAEKLIGALKKNINIPIQVHSHMTSGMAIATYVESVKAGARAIDCAVSPMSGFSSQPPVETMLSIFANTDIDVNLDIDAIRKITKFFLGLAPKRRLSHHPDNIIDPEVLLHHIPGGMISNLRSQLEQQGALDKLEDVMKELPHTRKDMGYPPLVTPTSQVVGIQSVLNVISGKRYSMVTQETKDYVKGLYGKSPAPIPANIKKQILGKEKPITCRPADLLKPILPTLPKDIDVSLVNAEEDLISFALFPEPALDFFRWRNMPLAERPATPADTECEKLNEDNKPTEQAEPLLADNDYSEINQLIEKVNDLGLTELTIRKDDVTLSMKASGLSTVHESKSSDQISKPAKKKEMQQKPAQPIVEDNTKGPSIDAPLNGTFYRSPGPGKPNFAEEGDTVAKGDTICIVEAMKLFNQIKAPSKCKIVKFMVEHGQPVQKGQPLAIIKDL